MSEMNHTLMSQFGKVGVVVGLSGVYLFAFAGPWSTSLVDVGIVLVLLGSLFFISSIWGDVRSEPVFWTVVILMSYLAVHTFTSLHFHPDLDESKNPHWSHWLRVGGVWSILIGWWLYRFPHHLKPFLLTLAAGLILGSLADGDFASLLEGEVWRRTTWGYSPNYLGMASSMLALGLLAWMIYDRRGRLSVWEWLAASAVFIIFTLMLYTSASRSAWIAFVLGFLALLVYGRFSRTERASRAPFFLVSGLMFIVLSTVVATNSAYLVERMGSEWDAVKAFALLDWSRAAEIGGSFGLRVAMWSAALEAVSERPWFGWGAGSGSIVLHAAGLDFGHFHNIYLEVLVSFGVVGGGLFLLLHWFLYLRFYSSYVRESISPALFSGVLASTVVFLVMLFNDIRVGQSEGRALVTSLYAMYMYSMFKLRRVRRTLG